MLWDQIRFVFCPFFADLNFSWLLMYTSKSGLASSSHYMFESNMVSCKILLLLLLNMMQMRPKIWRRKKCWSNGGSVKITSWCSLFMSARDLRHPRLLRHGKDFSVRRTSLLKVDLLKVKSSAGSFAIHCQRLASIWWRHFISSRCWIVEGGE